MESEEVVQGETLEEIADRIARRYAYSELRTELIVAIVEALRNEREDCAKTADRLQQELIAIRDSYPEGSQGRLVLHNQQETAWKIARAIREGR